MKGELKKVRVADMVPHPDNPRVLMREDVVNAIAAQLEESGVFADMHAPIVREVDGKQQILSGHQRHEAAKKAKLKEIPCWVVDLDDAEAFMLLVTSNSQGELDPLERGIHGDMATEKGRWGLSVKAYATRVGRPQQRVQEEVQAARVLKVTAHAVTLFYGMARHLAEIHSLPQSVWREAAGAILSQKLGIEQIRCQVKAAKEYMSMNAIFKAWQKAYLVPERCAARVFAGTDGKVFDRLSNLADTVLEALEDDDLKAGWKTWLEENAGGDSWDIRKCQDKRIELENIQFERNSTPEEERELVQVLLADPPWQYDFAETDSRQVENKYPTATVEEIITHIDDPKLAPKLAADCVLFLWATAPKLREALRVMEEWGFEYKTHAIWDKEKIGMGYWFRGQHEILLVGTRGEFSPPDSDKRFASVLREARSGKHSEKPECAYMAIQEMFPAAVKWEMYQRKARDGWKGSGNESGRTKRATA